MPDFLNLQGYGTLLVDGAKLTVLVGVCSLGIAILLGLVGAWGKLAPERPKTWDIGRASQRTTKTD